MKKVIKIILLLMCLAGVVGIGISVANSFEKDDATQGHIHKYEDVVVEATCTADGYSVKECACGKSLGEKTVIKATGHSYGDWITDKAATCTESGSKHKECANCDKRIDEVIATTGHNYANTVTAPTCTAQGYTTHTCKACEDSYVDSYVTATGHTYGDWIIDKAATCTEAGSKHKKCASCGDISSAAIEPTGHNYGDWIIDEKATCTEAGWKHKECNNCGSVLTTESIPIIDHDWDVEYLEYVAPTCTVEGYYLRPCNNCEATTKDMIAATGHNCSWESSNGYGWRNVCSICGDCVESWEVDLLKTSVYYTSVDGITGSGEIASVTSRTGYPEERKEVIGLQAAQYKRTNGVTGYFILAVESAENCTATLTQDNSTGCYTLTITNVTGNASVVIGQAEAYDLSLSFTSSYHLELGSSQNAYKACGSVSGDLPETISTTENSCITILSRAVQGGSATTRVYLELTVKSCENAAWCELVEDSDGYYFLYIRANGNGPVNVVITEK